MLRQHISCCRLASQFDNDVPLELIGANHHSSIHAVTLLLLTVEVAIVSVTAGLWTKATPPPKLFAVLFCNRTAEVSSQY